MRTRSSSARLRPSSFLSLVRARRVAQKIINNGMTVYNKKKLLYKWTSPLRSENYRKYSYRTGFYQDIFYFLFPFSDLCYLIKMAKLMKGWHSNKLKIKKMYDEGCSPDWFVEANHKTLHKSCIWHLSTGHRRPRKTRFIPPDFPYRGIDAIHYFSGNWAAVMISRDAPTIHPLGEDEHLLLVRLDTSQVRFVPYLRGHLTGAHCNAFKTCG